MSALVPARPRRAGCLVLVLLGLGLGPLSGTAAAEESCTVLADGTDVCAVPVGASTLTTFLVPEGIDRIALSEAAPTETTQLGEGSWLSVTAGSVMTFRLEGVDLFVDVSAVAEPVSPDVVPPAAGVVTTTSAVTLGPGPATESIDVVYVSSSVPPASSAEVGAAAPLDEVLVVGAPAVQVPDVEVPALEVPVLEVPADEVSALHVPVVGVSVVEVSVVEVEHAVVPVAPTEESVPVRLGEAPVGEPVAEELVAVESAVADPSATVPPLAAEPGDSQYVVVPSVASVPSASPAARVAAVAPVVQSPPELAITASEGPALSQVLREGDRELLGGVGLGIVGLALAVGGIAVATSGQRRRPVETSRPAWIEDRD